MIYPKDYVTHRRRINTEEKGKVVAYVWGEECNLFLAAPAVSPMRRK